MLTARLVFTVLKRVLFLPFLLIKLDTLTEVMIINISDLNDNAPQFAGDYSIIEACIQHVCGYFRDFYIIGLPSFSASAF